MTRGQAILALLSAVPGLASAADRPIRWADSALLVKPEKPRYAAIFRAEGWIEIPLDGWCGWRVTLGDRVVEITQEELMAALEGR